MENHILFFKITLILSASGIISPVTSLENGVSSAQSTSADDLQCTLKAAPCYKNTDGLVDIVKSGNYSGACNIVTSVYHCLESATLYCRNQGLEEAAQSLENTTKDWNTQKEQFCSIVSGSCPDVNYCDNAYNASHLLDVLLSENYDEACELFKPIYNCKETAVQACKIRGLQGEELASKEAEINIMKAQMDRFCSTSFDGLQCFHKAMSCDKNTDGFLDAISKGDLSKACNIVTPVYNCLESATLDCRNQGFEGAAQSLDNLTKTWKTQKETFCSPSTSKYSCFDLYSCNNASTTKRLTDALSNGNYGEACQILTPVHQCMTASLHDCKTRGLLTEDTFNEDMTKGVDAQINQFCQNPKSNISCFNLASCMKGTENLEHIIGRRDYKQACNIIVPVHNCIKSAALDCKARGNVEYEAQLQNISTDMKTKIDQFCSEKNTAENIDDDGGDSPRISQSVLFTLIPSVIVVYLNV